MGHPRVDPLAQLIARLSDAGARTDATGVADALWLAQQIGAQEPGSQEPGSGRPGAGEQAAGPGERPLSATSPGGPRSVPTGQERPEPAVAGGSQELTGERIAVAVSSGDPVAEPEDTPGRDDSGHIRIPVASAFPSLLPLERALRPLQRYQPRVRPPRGPLDEAATAETSARSGHLVPVFAEDRRREAALLLLMDDSPSMVVWDRMMEELRQVCEQVGAFRDVVVHRLRPHPDGGVGIPSGVDGDGPLGPAERLRDPTGRTVTLLLSDCAGALWRYGAAQRLLHHWALSGPVAVVQPLPQRMWTRTLLAVEPGTLRQTGPHGSGPAFTAHRRRPRARAAGALPVPVLSTTIAVLGGWSRMLSGVSGATLDAAAAWVSAGHQGAEPYIPPDRTAEQLVEDFQAVSSPAAQHLAVYLSAAPLAYPVMQIVQRAMMPQTGPMEMAEVLLSGLLVRQDGQDRAAGQAAVADPRRSGGPWYEFAPGVQEVLLRRLGLGEASLVLKHCSLYVERVFGRRAQNFPALAVGYLSGAAAPAEEEIRPVSVPEPFAEVPRKVLLRFQPGGVGGVPEAPELPERTGGVVITHHVRALDEARVRLERFEEQGTIRDLWEGIRLLRAVPEATTQVRSLLAESLLHLWEARQDHEVLAEAERTARSAGDLARAGGVPPAQAARAHYVLGMVLRSVARQEPSPEAVLEEAAERLEEAYALLRPDPEALLDVLLRIVDVVQDRYGISGDRRQLYGAQVRLDALLEAWPTARPLPSSALRARGGVLLALAQDALGRDSADEARALGLQAAADFEAGIGFAADEGRPRAVICRARLELAEARALVAGDRGAPEVAAELERALEASAGDTELQLRCLWRLAEAHAARYRHTADASELALADNFFARAQGLLHLDDPLRPELLTARGEALTDWAGHGGGLSVATDAVRVLRAALAQTPESDPRLPVRRLLFGRALRRHRELGGALTDLHEAEWILARAARAAASDDARTAAEAWLERGDVLLGLADGSGTPERRDQAAESYRQAAEAASGADELLVAARAHHQRGSVLERTAGPARALESYRAAWELWQRAGAQRGPQARSTLERVLALGDAS
ncbi:SAV_2336 N-terminal domain-related protein [Actinacidiphila oryziradicis]|uniref:Tetratricopeptide repeat protein n=1 Tax=Actinacidiphila oryziradicis TaxID=2571141 RepID=A0A4U0SQJ1_9ACTN|nr:SAV_2336 N-terminal domain-related protein [Actinacidiphila oryziradicis]TKA10501.1 hypothetical protein FCI23_16010 [Actinacidiphila oryziradicis]